MKISLMTKLKPYLQYYWLPLALMVVLAAVGLSNPFTDDFVKGNALQSVLLLYLGLCFLILVVYPNKFRYKKVLLVLDKYINIVILWLALLELITFIFAKSAFSETIISFFTFFVTFSILISIMLYRNNENINLFDYRTLLINIMLLSLVGVVTVNYLIYTYVHGKIFNFSVDVILGLATFLISCLAYLTITNKEWQILSLEELKEYKYLMIPIITGLISTILDHIH